jgi:hypothetical protein
MTQAGQSVTPPDDLTHYMQACSLANEKLGQIAKLVYDQPKDPLLVDLIRAVLARDNP